MYLQRKMLVPIGFVFLVFAASYVTTMDSSKALEGYPAGYLADCPGSEKEAIITNTTLKHLSIYVKGPGRLNARHVRYNYYQMRQLARDPDIDFSKKTMLFIGGYMDSPNFPISSIISSVYLEIGYNVLLLDTNTFTTVEYPMAVRYIRAVGKHVGKMLAVLMEEGLDPGKLEILGLSFGGQTMSFVAQSFREITGRNVSKLTGLDPAGPCFRNLGPGQRLDVSDADYVEVVSTNIDGFGMAAPMGHINFYVNGGEYQPGDVFWMPCTSFCSHARSFTLWIAVMRHPDSFVAMQCDSVQQAREKRCYDRKPMVTNLLGPKVDMTKQGIFYLATDYNFPYYLGADGLKKENEIFAKTMKSMNKETVIKM